MILFCHCQDNHSFDLVFIRSHMLVIFIIMNIMIIVMTPIIIVIMIMKQYQYHIIIDIRYLILTIIISITILTYIKCNNSDTNNDKYSDDIIQ